MSDNSKGKPSAQLTLSRSSRDDLMTSTAFNKSSSEMTRGGAKRML